MMMQSTETQTAQDPRHRADFEWIAVGVLLILGAALRLYRLPDQSLWLDEYPNVRYLNAPDLQTYLLALRLYLPEQGQAPIYYVFLYYVANCISASIPFLRLVSVTIGLTSIPLLYLLGRYLAGHRAGLIAGLFLALSPQHIWYSQEIRPSPFITPLIILSLYGLFRAFREGKASWLSMSIAANVLLLWTQLLTVLLLPVEALLAAFYFRKQPRLAALWAGTHALALGPWAIGILKMPASYTDEFRDSYLTFWRVLRDIFLDDAVRFHDHLLPPWKTNSPDTLNGINEVLLPHVPWMDGLLVLVTVLGLVWFAAGVMARAFGAGGKRLDVGALEVENAVVLYTLIIGPVATLALANWLTDRPFQAPNYFFFNTVGTYIVLGAVLAQIRWKFLRRAAISFVVLLYSFQLALFLPETTRPDWQSASKHVLASAGAGDLVLEYEYLWPAAYLSYYFQGTEYSAARVTSLHEACEEMHRFLHTPGNESRHGWLLFERAFISWLYPGFHVQEVLNAAAGARNMSCQYTLFPGHYNIVCVEFERIEDGQVAKYPPPVPAMDATDFAGLAAQLGFPGQKEEERRALAKGLRNRLPFWPPLCKMFLSVHVFDALAKGDLLVAEALSRHAVAEYPDFSLAAYGHGLALFCRNETDQALGEFRRAFELDPGLTRFLGPVTDALFVNPNPRAARAEVARLRALHFLYADALVTALDLQESALSESHPAPASDIQ